MKNDKEKYILKEKKQKNNTDKTDFLDELELAESHIHD